MAHTLPARIRSRTDAAKLWLYLVSRGISFHWDDDPEDWVQGETGRAALTAEHVGTVRKLLAQVEHLRDPDCYSDALALMRCALRRGREFVETISPAKLARIAAAQERRFMRVGST